MRPSQEASPNTDPNTNPNPNPPVRPGHEWGAILRLILGLRPYPGLGFGRLRLPLRLFATVALGTNKLHNLPVHLPQAFAASRLTLTSGLRALP